MSVRQKRDTPLGAVRLVGPAKIEFITAATWSGGGNTPRSLAYSGAEDADYIIAIFGPSGAITPGVDIEGTALDLLYTRTEASRQYVMGKRVADIPGFSGSGNAIVSFTTSQTYQNVTVVFLKGAANLDSTPVLVGGSPSGVAGRTHDSAFPLTRVMSYGYRSDTRPPATQNATAVGVSANTGPNPDINVCLVIENQGNEAVWGSTEAASEDGYAVFQVA